MTKAKKWKIAIIVLLGLVVTVLIAIGEGRFWKYQQNYIPDGTYHVLYFKIVLCLEMGLNPKSLLKSLFIEISL